MQQIGDRNNSGKALRHGLFTLLPRRMKIDRRTRFGKAVCQLRNSLVADLGESLSTQKSLIVDRIIFKVLKLCSYEAHSLKGDDNSMKVYLAMANSLRLDLLSVGLEKKERDITPLAERLKALAERSEKKEGDNGH